MPKPSTYRVSFTEETQYTVDTIATNHADAIQRAQDCYDRNGPKEALGFCVAPISRHLDWQAEELQPTTSTTMPKQPAIPVAPPILAQLPSRLAFMTVIANPNRTSRASA